MGQGGFITLVNGTPYNWERTGQHSYQMNAWSFPDSIPAGKSLSVYVEWDQFITTTEKDDGGEAEYTLNGTSNSFEVQARAGNGFDIQVYLKNITTQNNAQGSTIRLGWNVDGDVNFILSGIPGNFVSINPPVDWMHSNLDTLGNRPLRHICIPGTHHAGMSIVTGGTFCADAENTLAQHVSIFDQLTAGSRYFDIRPVISGGVFKTGLYGFVDQMSSWQGANGQSMEDVIKMINWFTSDHQELVILNLSHDTNTDIGNDSYCSFTQDEWNSLLKQLLGIQHLFVSQAPDIKDLTILPLDSFIGQGKAAVVVIVEPEEVVLGDFAHQGFYKASQFKIYNCSTETNDKQKMAKDQLEKMREQRKTRDDGYFLLSWTLTQDGNPMGRSILSLASQANQAIKEHSIFSPVLSVQSLVASKAIQVIKGPSMLSLASQASRVLYTELLKSCSKNTYPNVLLVDGLKERNRDIVALAMAVNGFAS